MALIIAVGIIFVLAALLGYAIGVAWQHQKARDEEFIAKLRRMYDSAEEG